MKDDAIRQSMASIENRVRHVYNQGFEAGRKAERKTMTHEEAVGFLQESGWLQDHDRQIYEQGKRDGIEERKTGRWNEDGTCSVCGTYSSLNLTKVKYCPECGAEMEGGAE